MKKIILLLIALNIFGYEIKEFVTCKNVINLSPINITKNFTTKDKRVYAFAYFKNIKKIKNIDFIWEKKVKNQWRLYSDIKLPIYPGIRWRTYSYITIRDYFKGKWRVSLFDTNETKNIIYFEIK